MYFDGVVNQHGNGIEALLITLDRSHMPMAIKLNFEATNNMAKYSLSPKTVESERGISKAIPKVLGGIDRKL